MILYVCSLHKHKVTPKEQISDLIATLCVCSLHYNQNGKKKYASCSYSVNNFSFSSSYLFTVPFIVQMCSFLFAELLIDCLELSTFRFSFYPNYCMIRCGIAQQNNMLKSSINWYGSSYFGRKPPTSAEFSFHNVIHSARCIKSSWISELSTIRYKCIPQAH
nr:hypothetical protein Iba_chr13aCG0440 [Ipomoea batatas]